MRGAQGRADSPSLRSPPPGSRASRLPAWEATEARRHVRGPEPVPIRAGHDSDVPGRRSVPYVTRGHTEQRHSRLQLAGQATRMLCAVLRCAPKDDTQIHIIGPTSNSQIYRRNTTSTDILYVSFCSLHDLLSAIGYLAPQTLTQLSRRRQLKRSERNIDRLKLLSSNFHRPQKYTSIANTRLPEAASPGDQQTATSDDRRCFLSRPAPGDWVHSEPRIRTGGGGADRGRSRLSCRRGNPDRSRRRRFVEGFVSAAP